MEINKIKEYRDEVQIKIAELLKDFEKNTSLSVSRISFIRQPLYGSLGEEIESRYVVDAEVCL